MTSDNAVNRQLSFLELLQDNSNQEPKFKAVSMEVKQTLVTRVFRHD